MPIVIAGLILAALVMLAFAGTELDRLLVVLVAEPELPRWETIANVVAWLAQPLVLLVMVVAGAVALVAIRQWRDGLLLAAVFGGGWAALWAVQGLTEGIRPAIGALQVTASTYPATGPALASIACFATAFLLGRKAMARALALGGAMVFAFAGGAAEVVLGRAWPSAVVGGWAFGLAWVLTLLLLARVELGGEADRPVR